MRKLLYLFLVCLCATPSSLFAQRSYNTITKIAGAGPSGSLAEGVPATAANMGFISSICQDKRGNIFFADVESRRIRKIDASSGLVTTVAGRSGGYPTVIDGYPAVSCKLGNDALGWHNFHIYVDSFDRLYISDFSMGRIYRVNLTTGIINIIAGAGRYTYRGFGAGCDTIRQLGRVVATSNGEIFYTDLYGLNKIDTNRRCSQVLDSTGARIFDGVLDLAANYQDKVIAQGIKDRNELLVDVSLGRSGSTIGNAAITRTPMLGSLSRVGFPRARRYDYDSWTPTAFNQPSPSIFRLSLILRCYEIVIFV